jgi:hypothetical protein
MWTPKGYGDNQGWYTPPVATSSYVGPGDAFSGATAWGSAARAYNAAFATSGAAMVDLVDQAGANQITVNVLSTGYIDLAAIASWVTANSVTTIKVKKLYDQTGNGNHWSQATLATMPNLVLNSLNSLPGMEFTSAANKALITTTGITDTAPYAFVAVGKRTANFTTKQALMGWSTSPNGSLAFTTSANTISLESNGAAPVTLGSVADNAFHAIQGVVDAGSSGVLAADGVETTGNTGTSSPSGNLLRIGRFAGGASLDGIIMEAGFWPSAIDGTSRTALNANMHGTNGYNF